MSPGPAAIDPGIVPVCMCPSGQTFPESWHILFFSYSLVLNWFVTWWFYTSRIFLSASHERKQEVLKYFGLPDLVDRHTLRLTVMSLVIRHPPFLHFIAFLALLHRCLLSPTTTAPCDLVHNCCDLLRSHRDPTQPPRDLRLFVAALAPFGNPG